MRSISLTIAIVVVTLLAASASRASNPDHLEPIYPYDSSGYHQTVFDLLVGEDRSVMWMLCRPSFQPEFAIILRLHTPESTSDDTSSQGGPVRWKLEVAKAQKQIWHYKEYPAGYSGPSELDLRKDVKVDRTQLVIENDIADELRATWKAAIQTTRYPEKPNAGFDGARYQFGLALNAGETWSPEAGLPAALVELSKDLIKVIESKPEERSRLIAEVRQKAKQVRLSITSSTD